MTEPGASTEGSPLWRFSLAFYSRPEVANACLALQDRAGVDVNLFLFLLWQAGQGRALAAADVAAVDAHVAPWRERTVSPLRSLRQALKAPPEGVAPGAAEAFRGKVKAVELEAERLEQEVLLMLAQAGLGRPAPASVATARANLDAYQATIAKPFPADALASLLDAFTAFGCNSTPQG